MGGNCWDRIAESQKDNVVKRAQIVRRLLAFDLLNKKVLEVGVDLATAAAAINVILLGNWKYRGTDVSQKNVDLAKKAFSLKVECADASGLPYPDNYFDYVWCLDVLEHVENKEAAYQEINRVLKPFGRVIVNIPLSESYHADEQEFGFTKYDFFRLLQVCGMEIESYEVFTVEAFKRFIHYAWAVGVR